MEYKIVNLVASSSLGAGLDLYNLATAIPEVEYEPEQFPGAILKLAEPKVSLLLFKNGKIIISGASKEKDISVAIKKATKIINEVQSEVPIRSRVSYKIVNLVATSTLNKQIDLFTAAVTLDNIEYEPEQFPGAIVRLFDPKLTLLLFKNGNLICAGAKSEEDILKGLRKLKRIVARAKGISKPLEKPVKKVAAKPKPKKVAAKSSAKPSTTKKTTAKKPVTKKTATKATTTKATTKKTTTKKTTATKASAKKPVAKKTAAKKTATKKSTKK